LMRWLFWSSIILIGCPLLFVLIASILFKLEQTLCQIF
jgi:hypothetical protein